MPSVYSLSSLLLFSSLLRSSIAADQKCFALNGTALGDEYGPCNPDADFTPCCAIHRPAGSVDLCLSNGLCMATNDEFMGTIWQEGCTDPTGMDKGCPKFCPDVRDGFGGGAPVSAWNIQMCDFGSYCCRAAGDNNNCCTNATAPGVKTNFIGSFQFETSTAGAAATDAPTDAQTTAAAATASPSADASTTKSLATATATDAAADSTAAPQLTQYASCTTEKRKTAIVGGTLGGILTIAVAGLLGLVYHFFKKEQRQRALKEHYEAQFASSSWTAYNAKITGGAMGSRSSLLPWGGYGEKTEAEARYIGRVRGS